MKFLYDDKNLLRVLDEAEFWKTQENEHTVVIKEVIPNLEKEYIDKLTEFGHKFNNAESHALQLIETVIRSKENVVEDFKRKILDYLNYVIEQSQDFINFLNKMIANSKVIAENIIAITVINHIIRESQYFIGISQTILYKN